MNFLQLILAKFRFNILLRLIEFLIHSIWAVPMFAVIFIFSPLIKIRFGSIISSRIGHFVIDSSYFIAKQADTKIEKYWFFFDFPISNDYFAGLVRQRLFVSSFVKYLYFLSNFMGLKSFIIEPLSKSRDINGFFQGNVERIRIPPSDEIIAKDWLSRKGWKPNEKFICLLVRDQSYLSHNFSGDFSYHNYRDTDIRDYGIGIQYLLDQDFWVIRLGKVANCPVSLNHPRLIDYPFLEDKSDLLDIWLTLNCYLFISTGTGIDILPTVYNRPANLYLNSLPLAFINSFHDCTWIPKHLIWKESGNFLTLKEHLQHCYLDSRFYNQNGILIKDLTEEEIFLFIKEKIDTMEGRLVESDNDRLLQTKFWSYIKSWDRFHEYHNIIHTHSNVGLLYLKQMGDSFFN